MRIAFFTDTFYPQLNGVVTSVANLAQELGRRGHQVRIFAPMPGRKTDQRFSAPNVDVTYCRSVPALVYPQYRLSFPMMPKRLAAVKAFDPDVIHFHTTFGLGFDAVLAAKLLHKPLVGTNHVYIDKENAKSICLFPGMRLVEKQVASIALSCMDIFFGACDLCLAPSTTLIQNLANAGCRKEFTYLPNGLPLRSTRTLSSSERDAFRKRYGLAERVAVHFGRLSTEKYVEDVVHSFAQLRSRRQDVSLLIIGDGPMRGALEKLARTLSLGSSVVFAGAMPHEVLLSSGIIGMGDLFVTASRMENQPMAVLEAMSHRLPIVAVREAGMVDLVLENGLLVSPGDHGAMAGAMEKIIAEPELQDRMRRASEEMAGAFSIENVADALLELYAQLPQPAARQA